MTGQLLLEFIGVFIAGVSTTYWIMIDNDKFNRGKGAVVPITIIGVVTYMMWIAKLITFLVVKW